MRSKRFDGLLLASANPAVPEITLGGIGIPRVDQLANLEFESKQSQFYETIHPSIVMSLASRVMTPSWFGVTALFVSTVVLDPLSPAALAQGMQLGQIVFVEPSAGAVFDEGQVIPIMALAFSPFDAFRSAEFFANGRSIGSGTYCNPRSVCSQFGQAIPSILQIPYILEPNAPPNPKLWQGWEGAEPGTYELIARATGDNGITLESQPILIQVLSKLNPSLLLTIQRVDGLKLQFTLQAGVVSETGFAMEISHDLVHWERIGDFSTGSLTLSHEAPIDTDDERPKFYRAVER